MSQESRSVSAIRFIRAYPADLSAICLAAFLLGFGVWVAPPGSPFRVILAIPLALFLPGYALVGALFPRGRGVNGSPQTGQLDFVERCGLALALSLVVLAIVGTALESLTRFGFVRILLSYVAITIVAAQIGVFRRFRASETERYRVSAEAWIADATGRHGTNQIAAGAIAVAVVAAVGALAFGLAAPGADATYTGMTLLGPNGDTASGYPSTVRAGDPVPVTVEVDNHEGHPVEYTLVVQAQHLEDGSVTDRTTLTRVRHTIAPGEPVQLRPKVTIPPEHAGGKVRVTYLLYRGDAPDTATTASAYRTTYVWVTVENANS